MLRATFLGSAVFLTLSGCARITDSQLNPFNWFGNSAEEAVTAPAEVRPLVNQSRQTVVVDRRALLQTVDTLGVDRTPTGAIVHATGTAPAQGYFNAQLVNTGVSDGVLTLQLRAQAPAGSQTEGSARSRQISAAYIINAADLAGIRTVRVEAETNARTSGR